MVSTHSNTSALAPRQDRHRSLCPATRASHRLTRCTARITRAEPGACLRRIGAAGSWLTLNDCISDHHREAGGGAGGESRGEAVRRQAGTQQVCPAAALVRPPTHHAGSTPCPISRPSDALASHGPTGRPQRSLCLDTARRLTGAGPSRTYAVVRAHPPRTHSSHLANRCRPRPTDCPTVWGVDGAHRRTLLQATAHRHVA